MQQIHIIIDGESSFKSSFLRVIKNRKNPTKRKQYLIFTKTVYLPKLN
jgi:hypothetical protein